MSGLGSFSEQGGNTTFLRIGMGKDEKGRDRAIIGKRAKEGDKGAVLVFKKENEVATDKDGNPVYRTEYPNISGVVKSIKRKAGFDEKPDSMLGIEIIADGTSYTLDLKRGDDYWVDFAQRCRGVDWSKPMKLTPLSIPQEDNPKFSNRMLIPSQNGENVKRQFMIKWHKEGELPEQEPGMPPPYTYDHDESEWKRKKVWSWLDQNVIQEAIDKVAFLNGSGAPMDDNMPPHSEEDMPPVDDTDEGDPPF